MTLESALQVEREIATLIARIADALDTADERQFGEYLRLARWSIAAIDVELNGTAGAEALLWARLDGQRGRRSIQHDVSSITVDVTADSEAAAARSEFGVLCSMDGQPPRFVVAGHYDDSFRLVEGRWRLVARVETWDLVGEADDYRELLQAASSMRRLTRGTAEDSHA